MTTALAIYAESSDALAMSLAFREVHLDLVEVGESDVLFEIMMLNNFIMGATQDYLHPHLGDVLSLLLLRIDRLACILLMVYGQDEDFSSLLDCSRLAFEAVAQNDAKSARLHLLELGLSLGPRSRSLLVEASAASKLLFSFRKFLELTRKSRNVKANRLFELNALCRTLYRAMMTNSVEVHNNSVFDAWCVLHSSLLDHQIPQRNSIRQLIRDLSLQAGPQNIASKNA